MGSLGTSRDCDKRVRRIPIPNNIQLTDLAQILAIDVYRNRNLLLTIDQSEQIRNTWRNTAGLENLSYLKPEHFHQLLLKLIEKGFNIDRAKRVIDIVRKENQSSLDIDRVFEQLARSFDDLALTLYFDNTLYAKISSDPGRAQEWVKKEGSNINTDVKM